ncbi:MAG TPA: MauE/DoxX family redox-associated membrane protein, partial [Ilumatobacteraceae bacterium]|nr:MauE/DoxX family redox-associated membrane protein [Ilumatobacteraceae bacterium]
LGVPGVVAAVLPILELVVGALLIAQLARRAAAVAAGLLLVAFTMLLIVRLVQGRRPPCACFGALSTKPISWGNVTRNAVLIVWAAVVAIGS